MVKGSAAANAAVGHRALEAVNAGRTQDFLSCLDVDVVYEAPYYEHFGERRGRPAVAAMFDGMAERFTSVHYEVVEHLVTRWREFSNPDVYRRQAEPSG